MPHRLGVLVVAALVLAPCTTLFVACDDDAPPASFDPARLRAAANEARERCPPSEAQRFLASAEPVLVATALPREVLQAMGDPRGLLPEPLEDNKQNPKLSYDQAAFNACLAFLTGGCEALADPKADSRCDLIFTGSVEEGGACGQTLECAGLLACDAAPGACGTCTALPALSEPCPDGLCGGAFVCRARDGDAAFCEPPPGENEACPEGVCTDGLACIDVDDDASERVCLPPPVVGTPCEGQARCGATQATGLACIDGACKAASVVAPGETCDPLSGAVARYCQDQFSENVCGGDDVSLCQARPAVGSACIARTCASGAYCNEAGVCDAALALGETCGDVSTAPCAEGLVCDASTSTCRDRFEATRAVCD